MSVGARSLPTGCPRFAGEHGPRTASDWQAGSELAWLVPQFIFVLHLARCSGMNVWPCGLACWRIYICANLDSSGVGVSRCHSCVVGARSLPMGCLRCTGEHGPCTAFDWQGGSELAWVIRSSFSFCIWLAVAACVCGRAVQRACAFTFVQIWTVPGAGTARI